LPLVASPYNPRTPEQPPSILEIEEPIIVQSSNKPSDESEVIKTITL